MNANCNRAVRKNLTFRKIIFTLLFIYLVIPVIAQEKEGKIKGRVFNAATNEGVPFATVVIVGTTTGAMTDFDGNFTFTGVEPGYIQLKASSVGFEAYVTNSFLVTRDKTVSMDLPLAESVVGIDDVVVKASPFRKKLESPVSVRIIGIEEIEKNPGGNRDISKVIQSFPGVASTPAYRNDVIVRGGGPNENRFYLDEIEIPYLNHFSTQGASGGPVGIINVDFIKELNFYSGAFPASRGNAMSSVLSFRQVDGNDERLKFRATVGASDLGLTIDGPTDENSTLIMSARRSYLQFLFSAIGLPFLPTYNDFQFKHKTRISDKGELTVLGIGALDDNALNLDANETDYQRYILDYIPVQRQYSYTFGIKYKQFRDNGYDTWILSRSYLNNSQYKFAGNIEVDSLKVYDYTSGEGENKFRYERNSQFDNGFQIEYGVSYENALYRNSTFQKFFTGSSVQNINYDSSIRLNKYAAFGQVSKSFLNRSLNISLGIRADGINYTANMANPLQNLSPRFSLSYNFSELFSFNFNTGRFVQLPPYTTMGYADEDGTFINKENGLEFIKSDHIVAGFEYLPNESIQVTLEGFYKKYSDYPFSVRDSIPLASKSADFGTFGDEEVLSISEGRAYGIELLGRIKNFKGTNLVLSYTLVRSEFKGLEEEYIPTSWDNKHLFNLTATKKFKGDWEVGVKWRYIGGSPYTPWDLEKSSNKLAWDIQGRGYLDYALYNSERLKAFHQLDVRVDKAFYFNRWTLMLYADVQNVYNFKADQPPVLVRETDENNTPLTDPENPDRYLLKFIEGGVGNVLPTVGIIVEF
ncbi:MAG: TonB-dependent receptor [Bacteroidales bacterium]|nr:TonB-dependent receptor [Bacteroidales bacterium]